MNSFFRFPIFLLLLASFRVKGGEPSSSTASTTSSSHTTSTSTYQPKAGSTSPTVEPRDIINEDGSFEESPYKIGSNEKPPSQQQVSTASQLSPRIQQESVLLHHLLKNYDREVRPLFNASQKMTIKVGITLTQIFDMDEKNQVMTTNVWLDQEWYDEMLIWNPKDYYNITKIRIPCDRIWLPDIVLYNNADDFSTEYMRSLALVESSGLVFWPPPTKFRSTCPVDVAFFPFDDQICMLKLGSWIHDGFSVDVTNRTYEVDLSNYLPNGEWTLLEKPKLVRSERYYPCCIEPFPEITISLRMRRKTLYYMYNIVFPCMMMSTLTVLVFCLPPDSGEKIALGVTVLLAFSVFMLAIAEKMPETSESIPLIGIYLTTVMAITSVSVVMTVIVLNFFYRGPTVTPVPVWAQKYILRKSKASILRPVFTRDLLIKNASFLHHPLKLRELKPTEETEENEDPGDPETRSLNLKVGPPKNKNGAIPRSPLAYVSSSADIKEESSISDRDEEALEAHQVHGSTESLSHPDLTRRNSSLSSCRSSKHSSLNLPPVKSLPHILNSGNPSMTTARNSSSAAGIPCIRPQIREETRAERIMDFMSDKQRDDLLIQEILKDWKMLAQQIDFFLFWIFLLVTCFSSILFIFVLPYYNRGKLL